MELSVSQLIKFSQGVPVILKSFVALAVALQTAVVVFAADIGEVAPLLSDGAGEVAAMILGGLAAAGIAVRKVTPTAPGSEGVLPE